VFFRLLTRWRWRMPKEVTKGNPRHEEPSTHSQGGDLAGAHEVVGISARDPQKIAGFFHGVGEALKHAHH
jgi:hypothetical protein